MSLEPREPYKPTPIHLTPEEIDELRTAAAKGVIPPNAVELQAEAEARNVFGHDAKKDKNGDFIEQGIGAPGNESLNHFAALRKAEREGFEPAGSYAKAVDAIWKNNPDRAKKIGLPRHVEGA